MAGRPGCGVRGEPHLEPLEHRVQQVAKRVEDVEEGAKDGEGRDVRSGVVERQIFEQLVQLPAGHGIDDEGPCHCMGGRPGGDDRSPGGLQRFEPLGDGGAVVEVAVGRAHGVADAQARQEVEELVWNGHDCRYRAGRNLLSANLGRNGDRRTRRL